MRIEAMDLAAGICVTSGKTTISTAALAMPTAPAGATYLRFQVDGADVRVTWDGSTDPVAGSTGELISNGGWVRVNAGQAARMKAIRNAGVDAVLQWSWWTV